MVHLTALMHGALSSSRSARVQNGEPLRLEQRLGFYRLDVGKESVRIGVRCARSQGNGVDDRRMGILWECADDFDIWVHRRIGPINDASRCLSSRDQEQGSPHVLRLGDLVRYARPYAEFL